MRSRALCRKAVLSVAVFSLLLFCPRAVACAGGQCALARLRAPVPLSGLLENKSEQNLAFKVGGFVRQTRGFAGSG